MSALTDLAADLAGKCRDVTLPAAAQRFYEQAWHGVRKLVLAEAGNTSGPGPIHANSYPNKRIIHPE